MAIGYTLGTALLKTGVDLTGLTGGLRNAESKISKVAKGIGTAGRTMIGLGAPLAAIGAASFKVAVDFDKSMRNVNSIAGLTEEQFQELSKEVVDFSLTTRASTKDVADSLYNVVSAGYSLEKGIGGTAEAMTIMQKASSAAGAGLASTADTSKVLIAALRSYNLTAEDADHVTDLFLRTVQEGLTTLPELASSLGMVLPIASQTGVSLEELGFALAQATRGGLDTAKATNYLRQMITSFIDPSDEMDDALERMGFTSGVAAIKALGLAGVMRGLKEQGLDNAEAMRELFPRVQGMTVAMSLMSNEAFMGGERFQQFTDAIDGTREVMRTEQYESFAGQMSKLKSVMETFALDIGMKFIPPLVKLIKDIVPKLRKLFEDVDTSTIAWAVGIGTASVAIGTSLIVIAKLITAAQTAAGAITTLGAVMKGVEASSIGLTAALAPAALALAAIAAAAIAAGLALKLHKDIQERQIEVTDAWTQFLEKQVAEEKNAVEIAEEYVKKQKEIAQIHERGGLVADIFVDKQRVLNAETGKLSDTLAGAADTYEDYIEAAKVAGMVTEAEAEAAREAEKANVKYAGVVGDVTGITGDYSEAALSAAGATDDLKIAMTESEFDAQKLAEAQRKLADAFAESALTTEEARHELRPWNSEMGESRRRTDELAESTVVLKSVFEDAEPSLRRLLMTGVDYDEALEHLDGQLEDGTITMSEYLKQIEEAEDVMVDAADDVATYADAVASEHRYIAMVAKREAEELKKYQEEMNRFWEGTRSGLSSVLGGMEDEIEGHQKSVEDMEREHQSRVAELSALADSEALLKENERYAEEKARLQTAHAEKIAMLKQHTADVLVQRTQELLLMGEISQAQADQIVGALASVVGIGVDSSALAVNEILGMYADVVAGGKTTEAELAAAISSMDATIKSIEETEQERQDALAAQHEEQELLHQEELARLEFLAEEKRHDLADAMAGEDELETKESDREITETARHLAKLERMGLEDEAGALHTAAVETGTQRRMSAYDREIQVIHGLGAAIDALPSEKVITITAIYDAPPELMPQSPILGIQRMLESAVSFAARNPIGVNAGISGGLGAGGTVSQSTTSNQFGQNTINVYGGAAAAILVEEQRRRERAAFVGMM